MTDLTSIAALKLSRSVRKRLVENDITNIGMLEASIDSQQIDDIFRPTKKGREERQEIDEKLAKYKASLKTDGISPRYFWLGCIFAGVTLLLLLVVPLAEMFWNTQLGRGGAASLHFLTSITGGFAAAIFEGKFRLVGKVPYAGKLAGNWLPDLAIDATAGFAVFVLLFIWSPFRRPEPEPSKRPVTISIQDKSTGEKIDRSFTITSDKSPIKQGPSFSAMDFSGDIRDLVISKVTVANNGYRLPEKVRITFSENSRTQTVALERILRPHNLFVESLIPGNIHSLLNNFPTRSDLDRSFAETPKPSDITLAIENKSSVHVDVAIYHYSGIRTDERSKHWNFPDNPFRHIGCVEPAIDATKAEYGKLSYSRFGWTPGYFYILASVRGRKMKLIRNTPYDLYVTGKTTVRVKVDDDGYSVVEDNTFN